MTRFQGRKLLIRGELILPRRHIGYAILNFVILRHYRNGEKVCYFSYIALQMCKVSIKLESEVKVYSVHYVGSKSLFCIEGND